jgi:hypothetical protein
VAKQKKVETSAQVSEKKTEARADQEEKKVQKQKQEVAKDKKASTTARSGMTINFDSQDILITVNGISASELSTKPWRQVTRQAVASVAKIESKDVAFVKVLDGARPFEIQLPSDRGMAADEVMAELEAKDIPQSATAMLRITQHTVLETSVAVKRVIRAATVDDASGLASEVRHLASQQHLVSAKIGTISVKQEKKQLHSASTIKQPAKSKVNQINQGDLSDVLGKRSSPKVSAAADTTATAASSHISAGDITQGIARGAGFTPWKGHGILGQGEKPMDALEVSHKLRLVGSINNPEDEQSNEQGSVHPMQAPEDGDHTGDAFSHVVFQTPEQFLKHEPLPGAYAESGMFMNELHAPESNGMA